MRGPVGVETYGYRGPGARAGMLCDIGEPFLGEAQESQAADRVELRDARIDILGDLDAESADPVRDRGQGCGQFGWLDKDDRLSAGRIPQHGDQAP